MNKKAFEQKLWGVLGLHQAGNRYNWRRQANWDALQTILDEFSQYAYSQTRLVSEGSLSIVPGTSVYTLNDWCRFPLKFWTEDTNGHLVDMLSLDQSIRDGLMNSNASFGALGPYELRAYPPTETAAKSGTAAATTEGDETLTKTGGDAFAAADVGRMICVNGEPEDYRVTTINGNDSIELDKKFRGRLDAEEQEGTNGSASNYAGVKWEIGPPGRFQIQIVPRTIDVAATLKYAFVRYPRRLIRDDDVPEISDGFHDVIWKGALRLLGMDDAAADRYQGWMAEYQDALDRIKNADRAETRSVSIPRILAVDGFRNRNVYPPGTYFRDEGH